MTTIQKIQKKVKKLPEKAQEKVLAFVDDLYGEKEEDEKWFNFSLNEAMKGIENDGIEKSFLICKYLT